MSYNLFGLDRKVAARFTGDPRSRWQRFRDWVLRRPAPPPVPLIEYTNDYASLILDARSWMEAMAAWVPAKPPPPGESVFFSADKKDKKP